MISLHREKSWSPSAILSSNFLAVTPSSTSSTFLETALSQARCLVSEVEKWMKSVQISVKEWKMVCAASCRINCKPRFFNYQSGRADHLSFSHKRRKINKIKSMQKYGVPSWAWFFHMTNFSSIVEKFLQCSSSF